MVCNKCGSEIPEGFEVCFNCGTIVKEKETLEFEEPFQYSSSGIASDTQLKLGTYGKPKRLWMMFGILFLLICLSAGFLGYYYRIMHTSTIDCVDEGLYHDVVEQLDEKNSESFYTTYFIKDGVIIFNDTDVVKTIREDNVASYLDRCVTTQDQQLIGLAVKLEMLILSKHMCRFFSEFKEIEESLKDWDASGMERYVTQVEEEVTIFKNAKTIEELLEQNDQYDKLNDQYEKLLEEYKDGYDKNVNK
ncbi:zinc ribbon domain-containing protein [Anaeromicropila populeti]|uniref:Zinc-ribbon domain-containing protein n=1 Tax=Anaeromicropila populeti TaxID=37658 RepID=A0A1I6LJS3_9FIRM|nr:zinc ribbon domain-containing protein [Anaeromicropila populeti]SFS03540.1 hypothetical protein SAMN05661086_03323 [Anaeromicropila populeti]